MRSQTSRRRFLSVAAAAVAAPMILPRSAWGANDKINIGLIGAGKQGDHHFGALRARKEHCQIVAVAEPYKKFRDRGVEAAGGAGVCTGYNDFREVLARKDVDAVLIATPDHWHAIPVIEACKAGKDIYCEKPLSLTIHEARAMVNAVRRYGRVFQTGSQQRSGGEFRRACELVRNGYIGKLQEIHAGVGGPSRDCDLPGEPCPEGFDWNLWIGPAPYRPFNAVLRPPHNDSFPNWRGFREFSGGGMTDWGAHHFDIAQWALGMDESGPVQALPPDGKDIKELTYVYANGIPLIKKGDGVTFIGTEGTVQVNRGWIKTMPDSLRSLTFKQSDIRLHESNDHHIDWFKAIRTRQKPICDVETGARTVTVCHLGNIAFQLNRPVKWDPVKEEFPGDSEANRLRSRAYREPWSLS